MTPLAGDVFACCVGLANLVMAGGLTWLAIRNPRHEKRVQVEATGGLVDRLRQVRAPVLPSPPGGSPPPIASTVSLPPRRVAARKTTNDGKGDR